MDSDFSEKLKNVLSDPDAMAKIMSIASGLGLSETPQETHGNETNAPAPAAEPISAPAPAAETLPALSQMLERQSDPRIALLASLKPLLREEKRERLDALTRALTLASLMKNFRK